MALSATKQAEAVIERIYTLPFFDTYTIGYGFGGYPGHEGTDYFIGAYSSGGERVVAALGGTVKVCYQAGIPPCGRISPRPFAWPPWAGSLFCSLTAGLALERAEC